MTDEAKPSTAQIERANPRISSLWGTQLGRLFEDLWPGRDVQATVPSGDLAESDDAFTLELDVPGVAKKDLTIDVSGRRVTVHGERRVTERTGVVRHSTRLTGTFDFETMLPVAIDESQATAELDHGVLTLHLPKAAAAKSTRIPIG